MNPQPPAGRARLGGKLAAAGVLVILALGVAALRLESLQGRPDARASAGRPAPELAGIAGWVNAEPTSLSELRGRVVLVDFWTYSCVNCVRTFGFLRALHERYSGHDLTLIGVHSPEFAFEAERENVEAAVRRHRIPYAVALDDDMQTWRAFGNRYWPRVYLIDRAGLLRFDHIGEGGEDRIEAEIRAALAQPGRSLPPPLRFRSEGPSPSITPEIYAGYRRGGVQRALGNPGGYREDVDADYVLPDAATIADAGTGGSFFLEGRWFAAPEYVEARGPATVVLPFGSRDVFAVAASASGAPLRARVDGDGIPGSTLEVTRGDLHRLVRLASVRRATLRLRVPPGFRLYSFTFG